MKQLSFKLILVVGILNFAQGCQIQNCQQCSNDENQCITCNNGYSLSQSQDQCNSSSSSSSPNIGLIIGIVVAIVFGVIICYYCFKKCYNCTKEGATDAGDTQAFSYGPGFGCMGMVDPMNCIVNQYGTNNNNIYCDKEDYYYNVQIYNKFKNLNGKCLDSRNDCDRCAFKLDRKENLFPDWSSQNFEKYKPEKPSKKSFNKAQFASFLTLIPLNVLELNSEELKLAVEQPVLEPIKKHSIDDKLKIQKQESNSNSEQSNDKDETASTSCAFKVRSISLNSECISSRGDEINTEEILSHQSERENDNDQKQNSLSSDEVIICMDTIPSLPISQKCLGLTSKSAANSDAFIIQMNENNNCQIGENQSKENNNKTNVSFDEEAQTLQQ
ncbi:transmembrane protein, putative (macronuclear) [Tetrahymena thermophila SB210]|uniref:Transmembrane protein, putative n=1 Tax=Tetrahymena thermophila (strain SB210) TaxID=312017 RepID=I7M3Q6_TETTS|nr:transmembrane protein, putative [Tetrahymena thermophila SB210]EAS03906.2 transmembrane protein, putative [Tetrahymena thermophila SB210]|eukprot:XP_001024151.2 transmembrane protein, putative [Tetrahymena thermophila SB210]